MATAVIMPKQGQSVETCIITKWFKDKGDKVLKGDILFSYETDKAAFDLESPEEGILLEKYYGEGSEVPVLVNVAVLGAPGEATAAFDPETGISGKVDTGLKVEEVEEVEEVEKDADIKNLTPEKPAVEGRIRISPRARNLADSNGLDYSTISGSGPNGRIIAIDIEMIIEGGNTSMPKAQSPDVEYTEKALSNVRKLIAKSMYASLQNSAQLTHHMSADVRHLLDARQKIKAGIASGSGKHDITLNDMICWCVIRALEKFPDANSHYLNDRIRTFHKVHLAIAVDTPRGLMVPTVRNADSMDLVQLSSEMKAVAESCKKGNINPELIQSTSATFTVSNLGNYGVEMFTPVLNLPQSCILGVCTIINRPASIGNNIFGFVPYLGLSLTYDHRAIDGGPATLFLKEIKDQIENFRY